MDGREFTFGADDGRMIHVYAWVPENPKACLQLVHGMMEHAARYGHFARWMSNQGIAVYANDHRGHGRSTDHGPEPAKKLGLFAEKNGWDLAVHDLLTLNRIISDKHKDIPVFMLGHSVGSALTRTFMINHGGVLHGVILSGLLQQPSIRLRAGITLAEWLKTFRGKYHRSQTLKMAGYGSYSKLFKPSRTEFDWLTHREDIVDDYINDPLCGYPSTNCYYADLFRGMLYNNNKQNLERIPRNLAVFILAGGKDPAGDFGKAPLSVQSQLKGAGMDDITVKVYPEGRHEMLNETNREEVYLELYRWIISKLRTES